MKGSSIAPLAKGKSVIPSETEPILPRKKRHGSTLFDGTVDDTKSVHSGKHMFANQLLKKKTQYNRRSYKDKEGYAPLLQDEEENSKLVENAPGFKERKLHEKEERKSYTLGEDKLTVFDLMSEKQEAMILHPIE